MGATSFSRIIQRRGDAVITRRITSRMTIGSALGCDVIVDDPACKSIHAFLEPGDDAIRIACVYGERLRVDHVWVQEAWLPVSCEISIGNVSLEYVIGDQPRRSGRMASGTVAPVMEVAPPSLELPLPEAREKWNREFERLYLEELLETHDQNVSAAARAAGVGRTYLHRLISRHELRSPGGAGSMGMGAAAEPTPSDYPSQGG